VRRVGPNDLGLHVADETGQITGGFTGSICFPDLGAAVPGIASDYTYFMPNPHVD
jgi:hypothetical protein